MKKFLLFTICAIIAIQIFAPEVNAAYVVPEEFRPDNAPFGGIADTLKNDEGNLAANVAITILQIIAGALLYFAAPLAVALLGIAAFQLAMGSAESDKLEQSKKHITWIIIGLVVIITSYILVQTIIMLGFNAGTPPPSSTPQAAPPAAFLIPQSVQTGSLLSLLDYLS